MISLLILMTFISFSMRWLPFLFPDRWEKQPLFEKIGRTLPICILLFLVAQTMNQTPVLTYPFGIPEFTGIISVVLIQISFRNILASMLCGIVMHQTLLYLVK